MLSIVGLEDRTIETLCREALEGSPAGTVCQLANYLFPQVCVPHTTCLFAYVAEQKACQCDNSVSAMVLFDCAIAVLLLTHGGAARTALWVWSPNTHSAAGSQTCHLPAFTELYKSHLRFE